MGGELGSHDPVGQPVPPHEVIMGDAADDMYEREMRWLEEGQHCHLHCCWFLDTCAWCEDGISYEEMIKICAEGEGDD